MTRQETVMLMATLKVAFPMYYAKQSVDDARIALNLWHKMFADDNAQLVSAAVQAFIAADTSGFPPTIGQIKDKVDKLRQEANGHELTPMEAWALVSRAISRSYYNSAEEFAKLPDTIQMVLGSPAALREYAEMDASVVNSVVSSNFQRSFAARRDYVVEMRKWPGEVKALMQSEQFKAIGAWPDSRPALEEGDSRVDS